MFTAAETVCFGKYAKPMVSCPDKQITPSFLRDNFNFITMKKTVID